MDENRHSFWTTLPGILTGLAALVTAVGAIYFGVTRTQQPTPIDSRTTVSFKSPRPEPSAQAKSQSNSQLSESSAIQKFIGPMGSLEPGVSYSGGDIYDRPSQSPEECAKLCFDDDRCRAVTFIISQQRCWIKNRVNANQQSSDMVSAQKKVKPIESPPAL